MATNIQKRIDKIKKVLNSQNLTNIGYPVFYKNTPVGNPSLWKSKPPKGYMPGGARSRTTKSSNEISANYPYARRLDRGWSKQSPDGMVKPTIAAIRAYIKQQLGI
jgi:hypothetical protein